MIRRDPETKNKYLLLRNYDEDVWVMRGLLLKTAMNSINQMEEDKPPLGNLSDEVKIKVKSTFQLEIISGIMMYIEDLIVLSESFKRGISHYELLRLSDDGKIDIGKMIDKFLNDMHSFSDEEFRKIFGYADTDQLDLKRKEKDLVEKVIQKNIATMRKAFVQIEKFSRTHHPAFKRFKHGGAPLMIGWVETSQNSSPLSGFDSYISVPVGKNPFEDIRCIPLSKDVLRGYTILINGIQNCLRDLVTNHMECIKRNLTRIIPLQFYNLDLSVKEKKLYEKIISKFNDNHPSHTDDLKRFQFEPKVKEKDIEWYVDLPDFLKECSKRRTTGK